MPLYFFVILKNNIILLVNQACHLDVIFTQMDFSVCKSHRRFLKKDSDFLIYPSS